VTDELPEVTLVSGETLRILTDGEKRWFDGSRDNYLSQTKFTETTDLRDLDRLLVMELMVFRLSNYLAAGSDYDGFEIDETLLRRNMREYSEQINRTKDAMGLNKKSRDEAAAAGDFTTWLSDLKVRAKIFGVHREKQLTRALVLVQELSSIIGAYDRSDEEERHKLGFTSTGDIVEWIRERMLPEFREIDEHFRTNEQRYWIRNQ
jgi:hypothetical protein